MRNAICALISLLSFAAYSQEYPIKYFMSQDSRDNVSEVKVTKSARPGTHGFDQIKTYGIVVMDPRTLPSSAVFGIDAKTSTVIPLYIAIPAGTVNEAITVRDANAGANVFVVDPSITIGGWSPNPVKPYVKFISGLASYLRAGPITETSSTLPTGTSADQGIVSAALGFVFGKELFAGSSGQKTAATSQGVNGKLIFSTERMVVRSEIPASETYATLRGADTSSTLYMSLIDTLNSTTLAHIDVGAGDIASSVSTFRVMGDGSMYAKGGINGNVTPFTGGGYKYTVPSTISQTSSTFAQAPRLLGPALHASDATLKTMVTSDTMSHALNTSYTILAKSVMRASDSVPSQCGYVLKQKHGFEVTVPSAVGHDTQVRFQMYLDAVLVHTVDMPLAYSAGADKNYYVLLESETTFGHGSIADVTNTVFKAYRTDLSASAFSTGSYVFSQPAANAFTWPLSDVQLSYRVTNADTAVATEHVFAYALAMTPMTYEHYDH